MKRLFHHWSGEEKKNQTVFLEKVSQRNPRAIFID
jgi:hypothetical protein